VTLDQFRTLVGDLHRPFAIIVTSLSVAFATVINAWRGDDLSGAALFIAAAYTGLAALYGARSLENYGVAKAARVPQ
jgi:hypothetical protein